MGLDGSGNLHNKHFSAGRISQQDSNKLIDQFYSDLVSKYKLGAEDRKALGTVIWQGINTPKHGGRLTDTTVKAALNAAQKLSKDSIGKENNKLMAEYGGWDKAVEVTMTRKASPSMKAMMSKINENSMILKKLGVKPEEIDIDKVKKRFVELADKEAKSKLEKNPPEGLNKLELKKMFREGLTEEGVAVSNHKNATQKPLRESEKLKIAEEKGLGKEGKGEFDAYVKSEIQECVHDLAMIKVLDKSKSLLHADINRGSYTIQGEKIAKNDNPAEMVKDAEEKFKKHSFTEKEIQVISAICNQGLSQNGVFEALMISKNAPIKGFNTAAPRSEYSISKDARGDIIIEAKMHSKQGQQRFITTEGRFPLDKSSYINVDLKIKIPKESIEKNPEKPHIEIQQANYDFKLKKQDEE
ncbi:MAG: hypothetical protein HQK79_18535 [Desulfobacterales bacterium]|nr:hypothetical protein [Desulfobacterales bacterium]MBF0396848.1 hypothetical protein [Desulfobacterales bacterium]